MYVIKNDYKSLLEIKNSKFITFLIKVNSIKEIDHKINVIKKEYPKATHYCYAYITGNYKKSSDDGEPGGTAGRPILNVLEKEELTNILCVVVRYFGGIKLGAGGLVRAYSKAVTEVISKIEMLELEDGYIIEITTNYEELKRIEYVINKCKIIEKDFSTNITYKLETNKKIIDFLNNNNIKYKIIKNIYIEKN